MTSSLPRSPGVRRFDEDVEEDGREQMGRKTAGSTIAPYLFADARMSLCLYYLADELLERQGRCRRRIRFSVSPPVYHFVLQFTSYGRTSAAFQLMKTHTRADADKLYCCAPLTRRHWMSAHPLSRRQRLSPGHQASWKTITT